MDVLWWSPLRPTSTVVEECDGGDVVRMHEPLLWAKLLVPREGKK
jgi:hypothetical protein